MMYGNKIDNLILLKEHGINVPDFAIIKSEDVIEYDADFINFLNECEVSDKSSSNICEKLKSKFDDIKSISKDIDFDGELYAVRSSSNIEDGIKTSFAGQFDTYLNVPQEQVDEKILCCFKSLYNENVLEYVKTNHLRLSDMKMNVIVQKMIDSELSGIIFTANPKGILNEAVITVGEGLGENVVQDKVETTSYYYNLTDKISYYEGKIDYLKKDTIDKLVSLAKQIEDILGKYMDIEFAIKDDNIYILQARHITTIDDSHPLILDNSNIVESYPGVCLPLTCSFVHLVYTGVFRGISYRILKDKKAIEKYDDVFSGMVGSVNGRMYYKISNWYTVLKFMPLSKKIIPIWQEMLGVKNKTYDTKKNELSLIARIKTYIHFIYEFINVPKNMDKLNEEFKVINKYFYNKYSKDNTEEELVELYFDVKNRLLDIWDITLINDMYSFVYTGLLKHKLKKTYVEFEKKANEYISGISNIESMKPISALIKIAYEKDGLTKEQYEKEVDEYIQIYGDRNLEELKLESKTFRTNRELLEERINEYRQDFDKLEGLYNSLYKEADDKPLIKEKGISSIISKCKIGIKNRETSRLNRSRIFGIIREIFLSLGEKFETRNIICSRDDIFYLTVDEVFGMVQGSDDTSAIKDIIKKRKNDYELYKQLPPYTRLVFQDVEFDKSHVSINSVKIYRDDKTLYGIPCSNGVVEGEALVIENVHDIADYKDKILITKMTDPGWVFLLVEAKGVISRKGSLLSHTAIISRELGVPSIVGVENLLETIQTGDYIRMDGTTGSIEILERAKQNEI